MLPFLPAIIAGAKLAGGTALIGGIAGSQNNNDGLLKNTLNFVGDAVSGVGRVAGGIIGEVFGKKEVASTAAQTVQQTAETKPTAATGMTSVSTLEKYRRDQYPNNNVATDRKNYGRADRPSGYQQGRSGFIDIRNQQSYGCDHNPGGMWTSSQNGSYNNGSGTQKYTMTQE